MCVPYARVAGSVQRGASTGARASRISQVHLAKGTNEMLVPTAPNTDRHWSHDHVVNNHVVNIVNDFLNVMFR